MSILSDLLAGLFVVAVIYLLVKPGSNGTAFVAAFGDFMSAIIGQATDIASTPSTNGN